jgi:hypothetical protein
VKVLDKGLSEPNSWTARYSCPYCTATLKVDESDLILVQFTETNNQYIVMVCAACNHVLQSLQLEIPRIVADRVGKVVHSLADVKRSNSEDAQATTG